MQEAIALVYGWPPSELDRLDIDELERWAGFAHQRLNPEKA
jgi:hypothetical protein